MASLDELLQEMKEKLEEAKAKKDSRGVPLSGQDLTDFTNAVDIAKADSTDAQQDNWFSGYTASTLAKQGTYWIDDLAGYNLNGLYASGERQALLDRLETIEQKADDAIDEVE